MWRWRIPGRGFDSWFGIILARTLQVTAEQIVRGIRKKQARIIVSKEAALFDRVKRMFPVSGNHWCAQRIMKAMRVESL